MPIPGPRTHEEQTLQALFDRIAGRPARTVLSRGARPHRRVGDASTIAAPAAGAWPRGPRPWLAATASLLLWGGGQWLNRQPKPAFLFFLLEALAGAVVYCLSATWNAWVGLGHIFFVEEATLQTAVALAGLAVPATAILCVVQAYLHAERRPGARDFPGPPVLSALASAFVPGWGQILNGQLGKAVLFLSMWSFSLYVVAVSQVRPGVWTRIDPSGQVVAGIRLSSGALVALLFVGLAWILAVYDAHLTARSGAGARS